MSNVAAKPSYQQGVEMYVNTLIKKYKTEHAREHAYRPTFEELIRILDPDLNAINDPKRSEHGAPDFIFMRKDLIAGYAETKDLGANLDKVEKSEQIERYFGYSNLILTNYLEFRFFRNGERYGEPIVLGELDGNTIIPHPDRFSRLADTLKDFLSSSPENIKSGAKLSKIMGGKARRIRDNVAHFLENESEKNEELLRVYEVIKELLVHDLKPKAFADMYAQTLVYGLFVARFHDDTPNTFTRQEARDLVPASNPFLQHFFDHIVGPNFDKRLAYIVNELCDVFAHADVRALMHQYFEKDAKGHEDLGPDPVIHFYEDFLKEYDAEQRKKLGAFYTPVPVVRFIVRSIDQILKKDFGLVNGLADTSKIEVDTEVQGKKKKSQVHRVQILDPAVGTGTFLNEIVQEIHKSFAGQEGRWRSYVDTDLLPRLHGFELMMAPYTIAHLKLGMTLKDTGYDSFSRRLGIYLTNSLEEGFQTENTLFSLGLSQSIAEEAVSASEIKNHTPIMIITGNPPYSGHSSNNTKYANSLVNKYKFEPGGKLKLKEKNAKWLNDDYVKFIAFSEDMILKNGEGILAMITNNGYLDNPTFRGMRWHLTQSFDKIYVLDLHGNSKKKETAPDGGKDENVFDIQQGVSIVIAVKLHKGKSRDLFHHELFGKRPEKFHALSKEMKWTKVGLDEKFYSFIPIKNSEIKNEYEKFFPVQEIFQLNALGFQTHRDSLAISQKRLDIQKHIEEFLLKDDEELIKKYDLKISSDWNVSVARDRLKNQSMSLRDELIQKCAYRPFDDRFVYLDEAFCDRPRALFKKHLSNRKNLVLGVGRQGLAVGNIEWCLVTASEYAMDANIFRRGGVNAFPLYLYEEDLKTPNLNEQFVEELEKITGKASPEDIFDYIYAVLHSPKYREKYKELLKIDFPRIPYPKNKKQFDALIKLGRELRELHLMKSPVLNKFITTYPEDGDNVVEKISYKDEKVFINTKQYFGNVPELAWNFYIGGYQPAQKWLKDRKGRTLSNGDIEHYQKIIVALVETGRIMGEIDNFI